MSKRFLILIIMILFAVVLSKQMEINTLTNSIDPTLPQKSWKESLEPLLAAVIERESNGRNISGDNGKAAGILQIHTIQVDEVNRISKLMGKKKTFSYKDRWDEKKSKEMFFINAEYWHKKNGFDWEEIARCWNGGPKGMDKQATIIYWNYVKGFLRKEDQLTLN